MAVWKRVKQFPDAFMAWAAEQIADEEKLPGNLGLELERMLFPRWCAQNKRQQAAIPCCPQCDTATPGFFTAWQRLESGERRRFMCKCCYHGKMFEKMERMTRAQARARGWVVMPPGQNNVFAFELELLGQKVPSVERGAYIDAAQAGEGEARREHLDELEAMGW